jgi:hypothetical protein
MTTMARISRVLTFFGFFAIAALPPSAHAEEVQFSLSVGQSVAVGRYVVIFRGVVGTQPSYDVYTGSTLVTRFPNPFLRSTGGDYSYSDVRVRTTSIALDGSAVTGIITTQQITGRLSYRLDPEDLSARTSEVKP